MPSRECRADCAPAAAYPLAAAAFAGADHEPREVGRLHAPDLREAAAKHLAAVAALPGVAPVLCHSDLHTLNLIDRGDSLLLLDWEYAHASDPLWDLAGWSANNDLDEDLKQSLLSNYTGRRPTRDERSRLALLGWLYDYVCWAWSELYLQDAARADAAPDGVAARAAQLAARLQASGRAD